jgi:hypothetical protein
LSVDAGHATFTCDEPAAVAVTPDGVDGGVVSGAAGTNGVFIADCTSAGDNTRLYTRTSSINPWKYSPYGLFPPIHNGLDDGSIVPAAAVDATCVPFTYNRNVDPSYVNARCVHAFTGLADGPFTHWNAPPNVAPPDGRNGPVLFDPFNMYESVSRCTIVRHPLWLTDGSIHAANVIADVKLNDADAGTLTRSLDPLKLNAPPNFPGTHVPPEIDPLFPFPDTSANVDPVPASNVYPATNPTGGGDPATVVTDATFE